VENDIEETLQTVNESKAPRRDDEPTMVQVVSTEKSLPIQSDEENMIIPSDYVFYKRGISGNLYKCVDKEGEMICKFIQITDENRDLLAIFSNCNPRTFEHWKGNWFRFSMNLFPYNLLEYVKINRISTYGIFTVARVIIDLILDHHTCLKNINMNNILIDYDEDMVGDEWAEAHNVELSPYFLPQSFHSENTIKAPEVHTMDDFSKQSDVYALGQVLCQLVTRSTNVNMRVSENNVQEVLRGKIPQKGIDLISQMIASDVDKRISAVDLQEHLLFTKFQFPFYFMFEIEKEEVIIARLSDVEKPTEEILQEIKKERFATRTGAFNDWFRKKDEYHNFLSIFASSFKATPHTVQVVEDGVVEVLWFRVQSSVGIMRLRVFGFS